MKKALYGIVATALITVFMGLTAFAGSGTWQFNNRGYWWQRDDGSYPVNTWRWIDGNGDGIAECYHFDQDGYMDAETWVEGWYVNWDGAWSDGSTIYTKTDGIEERLTGTGDPGSKVTILDGYQAAGYTGEHQLNSALEGHYEMHTELVDSLIVIENGRNGYTNLYFSQTGVHEDGSSAEEYHSFILRDLGPGQFSDVHHYAGDDTTSSGSLIMFDWSEGMPSLDNVVLNGMYMTSYYRQAN